MFDEPVKIKMKLSTQEQVLLFVHFTRSIRFTNKVDEDHETRKLIQKIWDGFHSPEFEALVLINMDVAIMLKIWDIQVNNIDRFIRDLLKTIFPEKNDDEITSVYAYAIGVIRKRMAENEDGNIDLILDLLIDFEGSIIDELLDKSMDPSVEVFEMKFNDHIKRIIKNQFKK